MIKRRDILSLASLAAVPLLANAKGYPDKPINLITPLAAGDAADRAARLMSEALAAILDTGVVVLNRPGAGGSIGAQAVIRSPKDGYTMLYAQNSPLTIRRVLEPEVANYDPLTDLIPLGLTSRSPSVLITHKDAPFKSVKEMVAYAASNPAGVRIGTAGPGSVGDISVRLMGSATKARLTSVAYKGASPAVTDLLGGHIEAAILALGAVTGQINAGALRALALSSPFPELPEVKTLRQQGYAIDMLGVWFAMFLPAGVPQQAVDTLLPALEKVARDPAISAQLLPAGITQEWTPAKGLAEEITREYQAISELLGSSSRQVK